MFFNDELIATTFIKSSQRKTATSWQIQGEDLIGVLDESNFIGGIYSNKNAYELMSEIFEAARVKYEISTDAEFLSGAMEETEGLTFDGTMGPYGLMLEKVEPFLLAL